MPDDKKPDMRNVFKVIRGGRDTSDPNKLPKGAEPITVKGYNDKPGPATQRWAEKLHHNAWMQSYDLMEEIQELQDRFNDSKEDIEKTYEIARSMALAGKRLHDVFSDLAEALNNLDED